MDWAVPKPTKLKYNQVFNSNDRNKTGYLSSKFYCESRKVQI